MTRRIAPLALLLALSAGCGGYVVKRNADIPPDRVDATEHETITPAEYAVPPADYPRVVKPGETLKSIARDELGSEKLWRNLKEWNKLADQPAVGATLMVPIAVRGLLGGKPQGGTSFVASIQQARKRALAKPAWQSLDIGERLVYEIKWFAITAGRGSMNLVERKSFEGRDCLHIIGRAASKVLFFFKVDDRVESFVTADELYPLQFEKHVLEGNYKKDRIVRFDWKTMETYWDEKRHPLDPGCRDLLGAFFFYRINPLPLPGKESSLCVNSDGKNYELVTRVVRRERIRVPAGEFDTVVIQPKIKFEGLWRQKGDIFIWLTDDARRIPVMVTSKVFLLGSVDIILSKMERWRDDAKF